MALALCSQLGAWRGVTCGCSWLRHPRGGCILVLGESSPGGVMCGCSPGACPRVASLPPLPQLSAMSEGWVDCPTLGPGWKRREAYRRSGATCGRTDTYYQGPNGEKFRSKIELTRFLGPSQDLTNFDFKNGVLRDPPPKVPGRGGLERAREGRSPCARPDHETRLGFLPMQMKKAQKRRLSLSEPELPNPPEQLPPKQRPVKPEPPEQPPPEQPPQPLPERRPRKRPAPLLEPQESAQDGVEACCASCQNYFPGVMLPSQRRCRWLCPDCRAQRRDFNREQRYFKRVGCGACQACQIPEDCGICTVCAGRAEDPQLRTGRKCLLRRCLKIVKKGFGCGACQGCQATEDCGSCYICLRRLKPGLKRQWKCLKRRCLKKKKSVVAKKAGYGPRKLTVDGPPAKPQLAQGRRCRRVPAAGPGADGLAPKPRRCKRLTPAAAATKWKPSLERDPGGFSGSRRRKQLGKVKEKKKPGRPPKHPSARARSSVLCSKSRRNRKCGECEACLLKADCGRCDFCRDKPKFGGENLKRQKCRWRQCLRFAMKRLLPAVWSRGQAEEGAGALAPRKAWRRRIGRSRQPARIKQVGRRVKGSGQQRWLRGSALPQEKERPPGGELRFLAEKGVTEAPGQLVLLKDRPGRDFVLLRDAPQSFPLLLQHVKEEPATPPPPGRLEQEPAPTLLISAPPLVKQEPGWDLAPVPAGVPLRMEGRGLAREVVVLDPAEKDEEEEERTPVIMEIYSLGALAGRAPLDPVLREFLAELQEIPLPAHWEVQPPLGGPDLRLVQRSARSTMAATVIHIRPGLFFQVVARQLPVPPEHEVYASHPARLTTVDEVVELICDLEAYRLCPGWPAGWHAGQRSQACDVLVYSGPCPQCRLNPWPSGSAGP
ncbi:methyl-CpG-binding domain protein 1 isoform X3 [Chelonia mydas]|uniref:methyl-CpG-binding domain protein 1 isoform X3 n=1 Tax=Chelonia mydas TaxID=8469 RepID=UPI001CA899E1|nr:methyl-CpG-binding domain protein 1 isoform X3 [Chelonia mydas]